MNWLDIQLQLGASATLTSTAGVLFANPLNQSSIYAHVENQLDQVGLFIPFSAVSLGGTQTYQFQVISDSNINLTTTPIIVADTGAMGVTDGRLTNVSYVWLPITFGTIIQQYVGAKYTFANTPSMTIGGAWLAPLSAIQNFFGYPNNYTL
jgi:hypothetical protein